MQLCSFAFEPVDSSACGSRCPLTCAGEAVIVQRVTTDVTGAAVGTGCVVTALCAQVGH